MFVVTDTRYWWCLCVAMAAEIDQTYWYSLSCVTGFYKSLAFVPAENAWLYILIKLRVSNGRLLISQCQALSVGHE